MDNLPVYVSIVFIATTIVTLGFVYFALKAAEGKNSNKISSTVTIMLGGWMILTGILAYNGFFQIYDTIPPRLLLAALPLNLCALILISLKKVRGFLIKIPITILTYLHIVRVPVEMVLWWLALAKVAPLLVTFEGINYDILSGVTAPFVAIFLVGIKRKNKIGAIVWNIVALGLLISVVMHAILSAPTPFQQFSFNQPMVAVFYAPYIWLPAMIVPVVFFAHMTSLVQLFSKEENLQ